MLNSERSPKRVQSLCPRSKISRSLQPLGSCGRRMGRPRACGRQDASVGEEGAAQTGGGTLAAPRCDLSAEARLLAPGRRVVPWPGAARGRGYFNYEYLELLWAAHSTGAASHGRRFWSLLWLELWIRMFVDCTMSPDGTENIGLPRVAVPVA